MLSEYLCVGGLEVGNNARARGYAESADCPVGWFVGDQCETLADALGDAGKYTLGQIADAPWYDPDDEATTRFYGYYVTSLGEVSSSTRQGSFTEGILPGGVPGRSRHAGRTFRVRAWLTANGQDALEAGQSWLDAALEANNCSTHPGGSCGATDATFFTACPPARKTIPGFSPWRQVAENLFPNPNLVGDGSRVTVWENLFTNPGFETAQAGSTTIPEQTIYRNDLSAPTTTGWTASLVAANGSGATGASAVLQGAAGTRVVRVQTDGATTSVNPTAAIRMTRTLTTVVGVQYTVTYQYKAVSSACLARVSLGTAQGPETSSNVLAAGTPVVFTATSTTTVLAFDVYDNPASTGTRDSVYGELGDVTVTQAAYTVPTAPLEVRRNQAPQSSGALASGWSANYGTGGAGTMASVAGATPVNSTFIRTAWTTAATAVGRGLGTATTFAFASGVAVSVYVRPSVTQDMRLENSAGAFASTVTCPANVWTRLTWLYTGASSTQDIRVYAAPTGHAWQVGETLDVTGLLFETSPIIRPYFDGSIQAAPDPDMITAWTGAVNNSASVLNGTLPATPNNGHLTNGGQSACILTSGPGVQHGTKALRIIPLGTSIESHYQIGAYNVSLMGAGKTYTAMGTITVLTTQTGTLSQSARSIVSVDSINSGFNTRTQAPNIPGTYQVRTTFTVPAAATWAVVRLFDGASAGNGEVVWDDVTIVEGVYNGPHIAGDVPYSDPDIQVVWAGTPNASNSRAQGEAIPFVPSILDRCIAIRSSRTKDGVAYPLRLIAKRSSNDTFVGVTLPTVTMLSGTIMGTRLQDAPIPGIIDRALWVGTPAQQVPPINVAGAQPYRLHYSGITANGGARYYHGGAWGTPDVWWTMPGIFVGPYEGEWFAGDTYPEAADSLRRTRWAGTANASASTMDTRTPQSRPETDEEYEEAITPLVRHVHDVVCISGPIEIETRKSSDGVHWGRLVEFTLYAGKPWLYGETKHLNLSPTPAVVIQDLPFNLVPSPPAELAGGVVVAATTYPLTPSLETTATGWTATNATISGTDPTSRMTSGRVTGELAAAGTSAMRARLLGDATEAVGRSQFMLSQMVDISARIPGARVSATVWAALINLGATAGTTLHSLRAYCDWYDASNIAIGSVSLGNVTDAASFGGHVFSQKSMVPTAGAVKALITVTGEFTWVSGANKSDIRLYADALGVTVP